MLVGDSGAMTVLGYPSTIPVSTDEMLMLAAPSAAGCRRPFLVADLPFGSYETSDEQAITTAQRFIKEAGATPSSSSAAAPACTGSRHRRRRNPGDGSRRPDPADRNRAGRVPRPGTHRGSGARVARDAVALQEAGCFSIVLEAIPAAVTAEMMAM